HLCAFLIQVQHAASPRPLQDRVQRAEQKREPNCALIDLHPMRPYKRRKFRLGLIVRASATPSSIKETRSDFASRFHFNGRYSVMCRPTWFSYRVLLVLAGAPLWAQSTATIVGRVADPSGAVIGGAKVTARNTVTGFERSTASSDSGDYELPLLPITGTYS